MMIEHLLTTGALPGTSNCAKCGKETDAQIKVVIECERAWSRRTGGFSWSTLLVSIFTPIILLRREPRVEREYGRDQIYSVPLPVCVPCQPAMRRPRDIKRGLATIDHYALLLEKFPDATVRVG
jgi:hypothetical protein